MKKKLSIVRIIAAGFISLAFVSCKNTDDTMLLGNKNGTIPRAVGPWQRLFTDNFDNTGSFGNWTRTSRFDYNSKLCLYDPGVPTVAAFDSKNVLVLTATKSGNIWKSGHVKSNYSFK